MANDSSSGHESQGRLRAGDRGLAVRVVDAGGTRRLVCLEDTDIELIAPLATQTWPMILELIQVPSEFKMYAFNVQAVM